MALIFAADGIDGYVARKLNQTSLFGATFDIAADRIIELTMWIVFCRFSAGSFMGITDCYCARRYDRPQLEPCKLKLNHIALLVCWRHPLHKPWLVGVQADFFTASLRR